MSEQPGRSNSRHAFVYIMLNKDLMSLGKLCLTRSVCRSCCPTSITQPVTYVSEMNSWGVSRNIHTSGVATLPTSDVSLRCGFSPCHCISETYTHKHAHTHTERKREREREGEGEGERGKKPLVYPPPKPCDFLEYNSKNMRGISWRKLAEDSGT